MEKLIKTEILNDNVCDNLKLDTYSKYLIVQDKYKITYDISTHKYHLSDLQDSTMGIYPRCYKTSYHDSDLVHKTHTFSEFRDVLIAIQQDININYNLKLFNDFKKKSENKLLYYVDTHYIYPIVDIKLGKIRARNGTTHFLSIEYPLEVLYTNYKDNVVKVNTDISHIRTAYNEKRLKDLNRFVELSKETYLIAEKYNAIIDKAVEKRSKEISKFTDEIKELSIEYGCCK